MPVLLNLESILFEIAIYGRTLVSQVTDLPPEWIEITFDRNPNGSIFPKVRFRTPKIIPPQMAQGMRFFREDRDLMKARSEEAMKIAMRELQKRLPILEE